MSNPMAKLSSGAITQPATTFRKGFVDTSLVLYDNPAPKTAVEVVWVMERGILKIVAASTRTVEVTRLQLRWRNALGRILLKPVL